MIYITQGATSRVVLPDAPGFAINPKRMSSARTAVAGNIIRQESLLSASSAEAIYNFAISKTDAAILEAMRDVSSVVTLHYKNKVYSALMTPEFGDPLGGKKVMVSLRFSIVRQYQ